MGIVISLLIYLYIYLSIYCWASADTLSSLSNSLMKKWSLEGGFLLLFSLSLQESLKLLKQRHMPKKRRGWFQWRTPQEQVCVFVSVSVISCIMRLMTLLYFSIIRMKSYRYVSVFTFCKRTTHARKAEAKQNTASLYFVTKTGKIKLTGQER